jgi:phage-related protein
VKAAIFHAAARETIRSFPVQVTRSIGKAIWELQQGKRLGMPVSRPMPSVAPGVEELRVRDASVAYRVFYSVRSSWGVLVFHAFMKRSQKTPLAEIKLGRKRLTGLLYEKAQEHRNANRR